VYTKLFRIITVDFDVIHGLLIRYSALVRKGRKYGSAMEQYTVNLQMSREIMFHLGGKYFTTFSLNLVYE
jgi:hypothetical protein